MDKSLFENPGPKIKKMTTILFWIEIVCCVILAFALGWDRSYRHDEFLPGIFFGFLIGGPLVAYCSALMLYGFGELVEKVSAIHKFHLYTNQGKKTVETQNPEPTNSAGKPQEQPAGKTENAYVEAFLKSEVKKPEIPLEAEPISCENPDSIQCPSCGSVQRSGRNVCWNCGLRFKKDAEDV